MARASSHSVMYVLPASAATPLSTTSALGPHQPLLRTCPPQGEVLASARGAIDLAKDDPDRDEKIKGVRGEINNWVARYRRDETFSGRPSFR